MLPARPMLRAASGGPGENRDGVPLAWLPTILLLCFVDVGPECHKDKYQPAKDLVHHQ